MRLGEVIKAEDVEAYLRHQLEQVNELMNQGFRNIIAYPSTKPAKGYLDGYALEYAGVKMIKFAKVRYRSKWSLPKYTFEAYLRVMTPPTLYDGNPPFDVDAFPKGAIPILLATDGTYVFAKVKFSDKGEEKFEWRKVGELIEES